MDTEHINMVKQWVEVDNKIQRSQEAVRHHVDALAKHKEEIQPWVDERKDIEEEITQYISTNKLDKLVVNISDGTIKFGRKTTQQPLTLRTVKVLLDKYGEEHGESESKMAEIYDFLISNLDKKTNYFMKREVK